MTRLSRGNDALLKISKSLVTCIQTALATRLLWRKGAMVYALQREAEVDHEVSGIAQMEVARATRRGPADPLFSLSPKPELGQTYTITS